METLLLYHSIPFCHFCGIIIMQVISINNINEKYSYTYFFTSLVISSAQYSFAHNHVLCAVNGKHITQFTTKRKKINQKFKH